MNTDPLERDPSSDRQHSRRKVLTAGGLGLAALLAVGAGFSPRPPILGDPTGDAELAAQLAPHLNGHRRVAAVVVENGQARFAGFGADAAREFEIGSISKTFTGALLLDAVNRGEVELETTVADVLGDRASGSAIAGTTLATLASHSAGLPNAPLGFDPRALLRQDAYRQSPDQVIDLALRSELEAPGTFAYSNLSVALVGQLLALTVGVPWERMLTDRLTTPWGLPATWAPISLDNLPPGTPTGTTPGGVAMGAWTLEGWAPSGGIRSTAQDMQTYLLASMTGPLPGERGLAPVVDDGEGGHVGITWMTSALPSGGMMHWHNGGTGGFASFLGWNPTTGRGVVLMSDTATFVDAVAVQILDGQVVTR